MQRRNHGKSCKEYKASVLGLYGQNGSDKTACKKRIVEPFSAYNDRRNDINIDNKCINMVLYMWR